MTEVRATGTQLLCSSIVFPYEYINLPHLPHLLLLYWLTNVVQHIAGVVGKIPRCHVSFAKLSDAGMRTVIHFCSFPIEYGSASGVPKPSKTQ